MKTAKLNKWYNKITMKYQKSNEVFSKEKEITISLTLPKTIN